MGSASALPELRTCAPAGRCVRSPGSESPAGGHLAPPCLGRREENFFLLLLLRVSASREGAASGRGLLCRLQGPRGGKAARNW